MNSRNSRPWRNGKYGGATFVDAVLTGTLVEAGEHSSDSSTVHKSEAKPVEIIAQRDIHSVAFLGDGKYIVSCDDDGKIRRWRAEDGKGVGAPMDAGSIYNIAVSRDGKWRAGGVGCTEPRKGDRVDDGTACVWTLTSGWRLLSLRHDTTVTTWTPHRHCHVGTRLLSGL